MAGCDLDVIPGNLGRGQRYGQDPPRLSYGMVGIRAELQQNLLKLGCVRQNAAALDVDILTDLDGGRNRSPQEPKRLFDDGVQLYRLPLLFGLPAEGEDLPHELLGTFPRCYSHPLMSFLTNDQIKSIRADYGTPVYVYDQKTLEETAREILSFPTAFGLTARYAMKALPSSAIVCLLGNTGLHIDASSGYEALRAIRAGIEPEKIQLTTQELPKDLKGLVERGVWFNACSLRQLEAYGQLFPGTEVCVRINPGPRHRPQQSHERRRTLFELWHLAREALPGARAAA